MFPMREETIITPQPYTHSLKLSSHLAGLVVEPDQRMVPGEHLAVKRRVVLRGAAARHGAADLDGFVQVDMPLLEGVRVWSAGEHGQRGRHRGRLESVAPTRDDGQGFLIQSGGCLRFQFKNKNDGPGFPGKGLGYW